MDEMLDQTARPGAKKGLENVIGKALMEAQGWRGARWSGGRGVEGGDSAGDNHQAPREVKG